MRCVRSLKAVAMPRSSQGFRQRRNVAGVYVRLTDTPGGATGEASRRSLCRGGSSKTGRCHAC